MMAPTLWRKVRADSSSLTAFGEIIIAIDRIGDGNPTPTAISMSRIGSSFEREPCRAQFTTDL
jgi:hypothetical protein